MTDEDELDMARVKEAKRLTGLPGIWPDISLIAARLAREGWTPPEPVDPDLAEAERLRNYWADDIIDEVIDVALAGIKRGRELERDVANPGMVWVKHDGKGQWPVQSHKYVCVRYASGAFIADRAANICWPVITHYAIITQPEDAA